MTRPTALSLAAALLASCGSRSSPPPRPMYDVSIDDATWRVELALTGEQQYVGMAGRRELPERTGMLFVFDSPRMRSFVMRGCYIPLDAAFIDSDLRIVAIHTMAVEQDRVGRTEYSSLKPAQYVLEVNAGELAAAGVKVGDVVQLGPGIPTPGR